MSKLTKEQDLEVKEISYPEVKEILTLVLQIETLNPDDLNGKLKEAFVIFDRDGDGKINFKEFCTVVRSIGLSPTQKELSTLQGQCDRDGTRLWNQNEVLSLVNQLNSNLESADSLREAFRIFDKDGNGYISASELRHVLTHLGEKLADEEVDEMVREASILADGQVCYDEFVTTLTSGH